MRGFVLRFIVTGIAVVVAAQLIPGVTIDSFAAGMAGVLVLAVLNAVLRPLLYLLSAPFIVVTLGLFMIVINAFLLYVASVLVKGFHVAGFWPAVGGGRVDQSRQHDREYGRGRPRPRAGGHVSVPVTKDPAY